MLTHSDKTLNIENVPLNVDGYYVDEAIATEEYGVGFRKGSDMAEKFNSCMDELIEDGTLPALAEKYKLTLVK